MAPSSTHGKLGYLVPEFPGQTHAFFWREVRGLREAGGEVRIFSTRRPSSPCEHDWADEAAKETTYVFPPRWSKALARLIKSPGSLLAALRYVWGLKESGLIGRLEALALLFPAAELAARAEEHELAHIHVHSCATAAHLAALCKLLGGPTYSLTLHGDLPVYGTDHARKMKPAEFVSTVTRPLHEQVTAEVGIAPERVPVIWMGVDTECFQPVDRENDDGPLVITTIARLNETKGHVHALRALRAVLDDGFEIEYVIAGEGPHRAVIEDEIERLDLREHVRMPGTISEAAVRDTLARSDIFVLPSFGLGEAAPVSVMEAMACGLPVICSIIGGTRDMIDNAVDGFLVEQQDEAALAEVLRLLANDERTRERIGKAARERARRDFDYRNVALRLLGQLERCA